MLLKSKISDIRILSDDWYIAKLAKFSSSRIFNLTGEKGLGEGGMTYIREKVGEELTGKACETTQDIDTPATRWGLYHEADAVTKVGQRLQVEFIVCQTLITEPGSRFGSTPDGLVIRSETPDGTAYNVEPVEVKCPPTYGSYIALTECETPQQLKSEEKKYYWQVIDQMDNCGALKGWFSPYHPDFKVGNMGLIEFNTHTPVIDKKGIKTFPIHEDLKLLRERKALAVEIFNEKREYLMKKGKW